MRRNAYVKEVSYLRKQCLTMKERQIHDEKFLEFICTDRMLCHKEQILSYN